MKFLNCSVVISAIIILFINYSLVHAQPGSHDLTFDVGFGASAIVNDLLVLDDGSVFFAGAFSYIDNNAVSKLAKINVDGSVDESFEFENPYGSSTRVLQIIAVGDSLVIRGYASVNASLTYFVTRLTPDGKLDDTFPLLEFNREIRNVQLFDDGSMLVSGLFDQINGESSSTTVLYDRDGNLINPSTIKNLQYEYLRVLQSGDFLLHSASSYSDHNRTILKKTSPAGDLDESFNQNHVFRGVSQSGNRRGNIATVEELPNGTVLIGGDFDQVNGIDMPCLVAIDSNGEIIEEFDAGFKYGECYVKDILFLHDNQIMVAGDFDTYKDLDYGSVIQIRSDASLVTSFKTPDDLTDVRRIEPMGDDRAYITGTFNRINGKEQQQIARIFINSISTSIEADEYTPVSFRIGPNFPNPFNPTTTLRVELPQASDVEVKVYDLTGRVVMQLPPRSLQAGRHNISLNASSLSTGIYVYRVSTGNWAASGKMTLVK